MRVVIGVMGGGTADQAVLDAAFHLGRLIAESGWVLLNGGRNAGVMAASARGAADAGGLVVGVLPDANWHGVAPDVHIPVLTGMGDARNEVNVLSSRVVIALRGGAGTLSEIALALKAGRSVVTVDFALGDAFATYYECGQLIDTAMPTDAIAQVRRLLAEQGLIAERP